MPRARIIPSGGGPLNPGGGGPRNPGRPRIIGMGPMYPGGGGPGICELKRALCL